MCCLAKRNAGTTHPHGARRAAHGKWPTAVCILPRIKPVTGGCALTHGNCSPSDSPAGATDCEDANQHDDTQGVDRGTAVAISPRSVQRSDQDPGRVRGLDLISPQTRHSRTARRVQFGNRCAPAQPRVRRGDSPGSDGVMGSRRSGMRQAPKVADPDAGRCHGAAWPSRPGPCHQDQGLAGQRGDHRSRAGRRAGAHRRTTQAA